MALPDARVASPSVAVLAWLTHWSTCAALVLLVVNDHVLKAAYGTWWTGKVSDVAWLLVAPPLLATALGGAAHVAGVRRATARACALAGLVLAGAAFVVVKSSVAGAEAASSVLSALAGPSVVLADATDLLVLPALAVAWAVARGTRTSRGRAPRAALVLVLIPATVLATAATSQTPPDEAMHVVVLGDVVAVGDSSSYDPEGATWHLTDDGGAHWQRIAGSSDEAGLITSQVERAGGTQQSVCVPPDDTPCFRAADQGLGVDRSDDAGETWQEDWAVTGDTLAGLEQRYGTEHPTLQTVGVAVQTTPDGYRVYAANAADGVAVRDEDGTWTRIGFTYRSGDEVVVPLPGEPTTLHHPVPVGIVLLAPAGLLTLALSRRRLPRSRRTHTRSGVGVVAAVVSALAVLANQSWATVDGVDVGANLIFGSLIPTAVVGSLTVVSATLMVAAATARGRRVAWLVVATSTGVAVAMSLVAPLVLAGLVSAALVAAGVVAIARVDDASPVEPPAT
ncbi:hypothetical protein [Cellulomonas sp. Leaf334]|uniref:hypothetical protein n=1 Tax=Cellulomonas sp. Leaf334 TaxID=1736339 RepID=UPI0006FEBA9E|nr:hypothetical protein [Cellulomonas sp. Leaf334]KQR11050.1 hypothetical protein ASF78_15385 [Cellulomonas sp. Leaf334]